MKKLLLLFILLATKLTFAQSDCATAIAVCGNSNISYTPSGWGNTFEILGGCMGTNERYTVWYTFTAQTSGSLAFTINPNVFEDDYDFALYGPNKTCATRGTSPIRCNYSGADGPTGLDLNIPPATYPAGNSGQWSPSLNVTAGETYILVIDNFSQSTNGFTLNWTGTAMLENPFTNNAINPFVPPGVPTANPAQPNEIPVCTFDNDFDFSTLSDGIINNNPNFHVSYHTLLIDAYTGNNGITTPQIVSPTPVYYYSIYYIDPNDPTASSNCREVGRFKFRLEAFVANNATIKACNNNNDGTGVFDLTSANVYAGTATYTYYHTMADLVAQTNAIQNPSQFVSAEGTIFVEAENPDNCKANAQITLEFYPIANVVDATLRECSIVGSPSLGLFDLTDAGVTTVGGLTKNYFPSLTDALNNTNEIPNPTTYTAPNGFVYVKVTTADGCFNIAKVTLFVYPPIKSTILKDKEICIDAKTILDAGPGFDAYEWSTGETTQTINVPVGQYWVNLTTGDCVSHQTVTVYPTSSPAFSSIDISDNNFSVGVVGGAPPYLYSIDNINWQSSNTFNNLPRGEFTVYIKDSFDCNPVTLPITVPNIINVITPNGDGVNDAIDYSGLAMKQGLVFDLFDRYGHRIYRADQYNGYKWDGTTNGGKKVQTGTYWYNITWNENNNAKTPFKYSGWIMVKNRE